MRAVRRWRGEDRFRTPRRWSNAELRRLGRRFHGDVVNVSAADDADKEGGYYRDYFPSCTSYSMTNFEGDRGFRGREGEILLDLSVPLAEALVGRFDVVFSHTTLEHVFDANQAMRNLCDLSRDLVIVVVPFAQAQHESESYRDYWRFTPSALRQMFAVNGLACHYVSESPYRGAAIYLFALGTRRPEFWEGQLQRREVAAAGAWIGSPRGREIVGRVLGPIRSITHRGSDRNSATLRTARSVNSVAGLLIPT